ncbi:MAG: FkbM family methyltransferase, partial [Selenomonadaceae bacterium]|nr:FkbM family methyltransferase [Selenomonadaceae bacterium]
MDVKDILLTYIGAGTNRAGISYDIATAKRLDNPKCLELYGFKVYSQNDEDGIIEEIFNRIGTTSKTFVEFGVENGLECNGHYLLHKGWRGLWLEGEEKAVAEIGFRFAPAIRNGQLKCRRAFITKDNINELIAGGGMVGEIDLLSIDIDGNDYYIWKTINVVKPRAVIIEYNSKFPPNHAWKQAYNAQHTWSGSDWQGASLKAYELLGRELGYQLVGTNLNGVNAFFVRNDLAADHFIEPATAETLFNPTRYYSTPRYVSGHKAAFYLENQIPNIGMLNYNPQEYNKQLAQRGANELSDEIRAKVLAKIQSLRLNENHMCYRPSRTHSEFFLPSASNDLIQQAIIYNDDYFDSKMLYRIAFDFKGGLIAQLLGAPDSVVVDVGANIGNHTLFFANELNASKIIAFEPIASTFKILNFNVRLNRLDDRVELHNEGLSNRQGKAAVKAYNPDNTGGTVLTENNSNGDINLTTLDALNLQSIALLKIDVEGMELKVLEGALETIKRTRPIMFVESFPDKFPLVEEFFAALDYRCEPEWDHNYLFYPSELDNWHDVELEDYDIVLSAEQSKRALPFIEKYIGHDKIIS